MAGRVELRHGPALFSAFTMTFGGIWAFFDAPAAMAEFGFPAHIAGSSAAAPVMVTGNARTTIIGALMFIFYFRGQLEAVDTILALTGAYAGLVDSYIVWREGMPGKALFRLVASWMLSACGFVGLTAGP
ncbi:hypothetical protein GQ53DRAFT_743904 [Thozetella sp. PMI_491]|nr:hypothetical protein GQ53DRAFT_743904 [Thozetella sp. PMI_491]